MVITSLKTKGLNNMNFTETLKFKAAKIAYTVYEESIWTKHLGWIWSLLCTFLYKYGHTWKIDYLYLTNI